MCLLSRRRRAQGFFGPRTPVDNLYASPIALSYFKNKRLTNPVVVSPDAGGVARAKLFLDALCSDNIGASGSLAVIIKQRAQPGVVAAMHIVGSVDGCDVIESSTLKPALGDEAQALSPSLPSR